MQLFYRSRCSCFDSKSMRVIDARKKIRKFFSAEYKLKKIFIPLPRGTIKVEFFEFFRSALITPINKKDFSFANAR